MTTNDSRTLSSTAQESIRIRAVKAVLAGHSQVEVAEMFSVPRQTVGVWMKIYRKGGFAALKAKKRGRPRGGSLLPWQAAQIVRAIDGKTPDQLKLPFCLWTREAVAQLIERRFGIGLSVWTVGRYLEGWGFTPQKPVRRAFEQNPEKVKEWLEASYPSIQRRAKAEGAEIYWGDEMGLRSDHVVGRTYGRKGETPVIPGTGRRFGVNMISAITNRGRMNFMVFKERFRVPVFRDFLKRLVKQAGRKVYLIVDGHPVHRASGIRKWGEQNKEKIEIFYLPGYSPDLNPDEMLNQDVKSNAVGRRRAHTQKELILNVRGYLRSTQQQPHIVRSYFEEKSVRYAAAA